MTIAANARPGPREEGGTVIDAATFDVLNAIYLRKMAPVPHIASVTELSEAQVSDLLQRELEEAAVLDMGGAFLLLEPGTAKVLAFYRGTYAALRAEGGILRWYDKFETALNQQFIRAVSEWQTSDGDDRARDKMAKLVERMVRHLGQVVDEIPRYGKYANRFERALALVDQGEQDFVCKPTVDSMHNVWFEFHEDILAVVGRPRDV
ncbi:hypothetical protein [Zavarzinia compransoris]|uniref:Uncharacterized protein n=1 Tax=Zavarzinia compransoris TaxID=1264899 RepID=A0A317E989_9PROT|nr:hypothetical protein [Zavarzinia compransoris]PWR21675.1 hypothetical protein DKG75_06650 [Zavarzinia compransoris]TDP45542.1 hypothetical protein DES42_105249 [Zavarzinia compransoris]